MAVKMNTKRPELTKELLTKLYLQERKSTYVIAEMTGWSSDTVRYQCIIHGIKRRPRAEHRKINIDKSLLQKLYIDERKSVDNIAGILSCNPSTILRRLNEYKIHVRRGRIEGLTKRLLEKLYVKEGRSTRDIGRLFDCSRFPVQSRCREFGIPLRKPRRMGIEIGEETLRRLYLAEDRSMAEIAHGVGCCRRTVYSRVKRLGLVKKRRGIANGKQ